MNVIIKMIDMMCCGNKLENLEELKAIFLKMDKLAKISDLVAHADVNRKSYCI